MGKAPEREYKGSFNIRIDPKIHQLAAFKAETLHILLNQFVERAIEKQISDLIGDAQQKYPGKIEINHCTAWYTKLVRQRTTPAAFGQRKTHHCANKGQKHIYKAGLVIEPAKP